MGPGAVGSGTNGAGTMRPVPIVIHRIAGARNGIDSVDVIHEAIQVIVNPIARNFSGVYPHIGRKVLVGVSNTCVDDANDNAGISGSHVPCSGSINIRIRSTPGLSRIVQPPEATVRKSSV